MKIFIIGPAYPLRGGPAQFNENLCRQLNLAGHDAQIISYSLQYPSFLFPGESQFEKNGAAPKDLKIHTLINTVNPFNWIKVAAFIRREKPDFILFRYWLPFFGPSLGTIGRLVKKHTRVLALTDNIIPHEKRPGDDLFTRYFVKNCHGFIAMSQAVLKDISKFSATSNKVYSPHPMYETYGTPIGREEARKKLKLDANAKIVLFFGLVRHYKGLDLLMEAMAHPEIKKEDIRLLVAGEFYEDKKPYLELAEKLQLEDRLILHDHFISNDEVRYYFCAADLVAQTYRNATNSGVTMVAYYYEKPVLVTDTGGLSEIVPDGKCGYVVQAALPEISAGILDFFIHRRAAEFSANVREEKKKYEWNAFINSLLKLYNMC